eukprot:TRINITY_DN11472_c0_g1_i4.p1 TRINITY_DN11472_c0_g1~~TRINITY_DN11472_c0_g1_i4.p1  ORF type:complete len:570 (+),score=97.62 TRINITY_DN11472_c0_g1_i4:45-1754(+)
MASQEDVLVLYGSQTGTAEDVAESVGRVLTRHYVSNRVVAMDEYNIQGLVQQPTVLFVCSTTGQGETPDNMRKFWRFLLQKRLRKTSLQQLAFSCFGLGDSSYPKFNFVAKKLNKRLQQLGGSILADIGLADDQHPLGVEGALQPWLQTVLNNVLKKHPLPTGQLPMPPTTLLPSKYTLRPSTETPIDQVWPSLPPATLPSREHPYLAKLVSNKRMTSPDHFQDARNSSKDVDFLLDWLEMDGNTPLKLSPRDSRTRVPARLHACTVTLRQLLTYDLDIRGIPKRYFFKLLGHFAASEHEVERLREFLTIEGQDELIDYCIRMKRTCLEVLTDFPSTKGRIPLDYLMDMFSPLAPRAFSIASNQQVHPGRIELCIAVVKYKTKMAVPRTGVFTSWLASLDEQPQDIFIPMWTQQGTFKVPPPDTSLICVGPGTGVAPFRSILMGREPRIDLPDVLVFGNRNRDADYLFGDEWDCQERKGGLKLLTAFSRDQEHKVYVQHVMLEQKQLLWEGIAQGATILLAGNANQMPKQVREAIVEIVKDGDQVSLREAEIYVSYMEKTGRYQVETWS